MPSKPNAESILENYSLQEIIDLAKEKNTRIINERISEAQNTLSNLIESMGHSVEEPIELKEEEPPQTKPKYRKKPGPKSGSKLPLSELLLDTLGDEPMDMQGIIDELEKKGWKTKSSEPRRVLYQELKKQINKGNIRKEGRGLYAKK